MKRCAVLTCLLAIAAGLPLAAQTQMQQPEKTEPTLQTSGYCSFEFLKGQPQSPYHLGSVQNLRAGLLFSGQFAAVWDYQLESGFRTESGVSLEQAFLRLSLSQAVRVRAGMFLVPFGLYNTANRPYEQALARVPLVVEEAYPASWREIGLCLEGRIDFLDYALYAGNGLGEGARLADGQQFRDRNADKGLGGRAGVLIDTIELGFSYYRGKVDDRNSRELILQAADASWKTTNFQLLGEYLQAWLDNPAPYGRGKCWGYHVQLFFPFNPASIVVSRQELKYRDPFHGAGFQAPDVAGLGIDENKNRWALELLYAPFPYLIFKAEYDFNREAGPARRDDLITAQIAFKF
jgi:hypothetical protein